ncbi:MAG: glutamate racemase [Legionellales bacterium]|nr:glutamate racemase [Legionellales bacterium]
MTKPQLAIGVFDSGMGGLTVLRALKHRLPNESFIYLGDTARLPYGTKSLQTVTHYAKQMARVLVKRRIKALVIACNTATTAALPHLQAMLPHIPVLGVVAPGAMAAVRATLNQRIIVLATETTIATEAYHNLITTELPKATILSRGCSVLVALAEEGLVDNAMAETALLHYLKDRQDEDTVLLGCTHFPVFKPLLSRLLPENIRVVDSADATANALQHILTENGLLNPNHSTTGKTQYLVTDSISRFQKVGELFLNEPLLISDIELIDV